VNNYENCEIHFLGIPNIHTMRESLAKVRDLCAITLAPSDPKYAQLLDESGWIHHLHLILAGAELLTQLIQNGHPVLIHCSDGWDRTAQLVSLAQIMLDPFFRTILGFEILIEKEWLSFGHKFSDRSGQSKDSGHEDERAPIFHQFIDSMAQILQQYPCEFEFNEHFLITISDHSYSSQFGTFICNSDKERDDHAVKARTVSLWSYINSSLHEFQNPFYRPNNPMEVITTVSCTQNLKFWNNYYFRWRPDILHQVYTSTQCCQDLLELEKQKIRNLESEIVLWKKLALNNLEKKDHNC